MNKTGFVWVFPALIWLLLAIFSFAPPHTNYWQEMTVGVVCLLSAGAFFFIAVADVLEWYL
jgi:hypothetical protein